jgi:hypothetical protein
MRSLATPATAVVIICRYRLKVVELPHLGLGVTLLLNPISLAQLCGSLTRPVDSGADGVRVAG